MSVFSNGTEGDAWMGAWCEHCANDHAMHATTDGHAGDPADGCELVLHMMTSDEWPEAILPEPPGEFHLPPLHLCGLFKPCEPCGGDPLAETRVSVIAHTTSQWARHKAGLS